MSNLSIYYLSVAVTCLAISIYNFSVQRESKFLQCFKLQEMTETDYQGYLESISNQTTDYTNYMMIINRNITNEIFTEENRYDNPDDDLITVPILEKNRYPNLQEAIGAIYIIIMILCTLQSLSIRYMSNMVPEEFLKMDKLTEIFGFVAKNLPYLIVSLHYSIFVLIIVLWGYIGTTACYYSVYTDPGKYKYWNKYYTDTWIMNLVTSIFWILIHYIGSVIREIFYKEPFMYIHSLNHQKGKFRCMRVLLTKLGP